MSSSEFQASLLGGHRHFRAGRFFEAHEAWEAGWTTTRGLEKQLLQVLVLWATACHHARNANRTGALNLTKRALERLALVSESRAPFDLEVLREALVQTWEQLSGPTQQLPVPPEWDPAPSEAPVEETIDLTHRSRCPYCGEQVAIEVEPELSGGAQYVEDCPVCCQPWAVTVRNEGGQMAVVLQRGDD
jgi:hypothetical protein